MMTREALEPSVPISHRIRRDLCAQFDHPGVCFNPLMDKTWCQCGEVIREGNHHTHAACAAPCGGPRGGVLIEWIARPPMGYMPNRHDFVEVSPGIWDLPVREAVA